jgi:TolB-like protein/Flp pilus assembly protein TadD
MSRLKSGESVSHYRLLERIGRGGMGDVWLAEDTLLPRRVAIKFLLAHLESDNASVERLLREARAAATVDHPNVVTVYEAGMHDGQPFLAMQYLEGESLQQRLARGPLPVAEAVDLAKSIADALAEVHELGIVHRDLKPANIMMTPRGPHVLDFGVSAIRGQTRLTASGFSMGTPVAMSPEQITGRPPDNRSDLWGLGVILYEALTGVQPFAADDFAAVVHRVMNESPPPPSTHNPGIGPKLDLIVGKLLRKDAALRYGRAEDVLCDLADATLDTAARETGPQPVTETRLAVLPFEVLSSDPEDEFLAAGLTEDLIVDLARVRGLRVSGRGEVQTYRDRALPARTIARELGADYVVLGSVRRAGVRARISAQLVRATDGHAVWAERFDRTIEDLFDVQAEVSKRIVEALQITLRPTEHAMLSRAPTDNREAYAFYLRGRAHQTDWRRSSSREAEACYRKAIALDPNFALAHCALAECLALRAMAWWVEPGILEEATEHAKRALALDPDLPEAHMALGLIHRAAGDHEGVLREVKAAQKLDSNDRDIMLWVAASYMRVGRPQEAIDVLERALRLHPRDVRILSVYSDSSDMLGRKDVVAHTLVRMREVCLETLERSPDDAFTRSMLSIVLAQLGETQAGVEQAEQAIAGNPEDGRILYNSACTFIYAGDNERAMTQLRTLVRSHPGFPREWPRHDPDLAPLRNLPEFIELFGKAGQQTV